jgi:hypothetical protein
VGYVEFVDLTAGRRPHTQFLPDIACDFVDVTAQPRCTSQEHL